MNVDALIRNMQGKEEGKPAVMHDTSLGQALFLGFCLFFPVAFVAGKFLGLVFAGP